MPRIKKKRYRKKYIKRTGKPSAGLTSKVKKIINRSGEVKVRTIFEDQEVFVWSDATAEIQGYNIFENIPEVGASREQRIGNKIFVKNVTMEFSYGNQPNAANLLLGHVTLFILKEKKYDGHGNVASFIIQEMNGKLNSFEPRMMQTTYKSVQRKDFYLGPAWGQQVVVGDLTQLCTAPVHKHTIRFKKTIKVNKQITYGEDGFANIPGVYFVWVRWGAGYTENIGEPVISMKSSIKFTD